MRCTVEVCDSLRKLGSIGMMMRLLLMIVMPLNGVESYEHEEAAYID